MSDLSLQGLLGVAVLLAFAGLALAAVWRARARVRSRSPRAAGPRDDTQVSTGKLLQQLNEDITASLSVSFFQMRQEPDGRIRLPYVAGRTERFLPWNQQDLMHRGGGVFPNVLEEDRPRADAALANSLATGAPILLDLRVHRVAGSGWMRIGTGVPRTGPSGAAVWNGYLADVTGEHQQAEALIAARKLAEEAASAKARFVAAMSHEIRTPLATVIASLELLRDAPLGTTHRDELELAENAAGLLMEILGDILDFSRLEAGQMSVELRPLDLRALLDDVVRVHGRQIRRKGLSLDHHVEAGIAAEVSGDAVRLKQILLNLIGNASKFTERGGIEVSVSLRSEDARTQRILLAVSDTGIGIPEEKQRDMFEPFVQADSSTSRRFGGSGLGLAICRRLVASMDGEIRLRSQTGVGTTVEVELPMPVLRRSIDAPTRVARKRMLIDGEAPVKVAKNAAILVVEDHQPYQIVIRRQIEKLGFSCDVVGDGLEALAALEVRRYAMVITDCHMPNLDGYGLTSRIRVAESSADQRLPVVALSADITEEQVQRGRTAGMDDFLVKPLRLQELRACIEKWLPQ